MNRETLYELAFRYKKTKLWKRLFDDQIFAVRTEGGETISSVLWEYSEITSPSPSIPETISAPGMTVWTQIPFSADRRPMTFSKKPSALPVYSAPLKAGT